MPFYEYQCQTCGHELEVLQKISDDALKECPSCKKSDLKKLISAAGFQLKGTGWYATDFKDNGKKKSDKDSGKKKNEASKDAKPVSSHSCGGGNCGHKH